MRRYIFYSLMILNFSDRSIFFHTSKALLVTLHPHTPYSQQFHPFYADIDLIVCHPPILLHHHPLPHPVQATHIDCSTGALCLIALAIYMRMWGQGCR